MKEFFSHKESHNMKLLKLASFNSNSTQGIKTTLLCILKSVANVFKANMEDVSRGRSPVSNFSLHIGGAAQGRPLSTLPFSGWRQQVLFVR